MHSLTLAWLLLRPPAHSTPWPKPTASFFIRDQQLERKVNNQTASVNARRKAAEAQKKARKERKEPGQTKRQTKSHAKVSGGGGEGARGVRIGEPFFRSVLAHDRQTKGVACVFAAS